MATFPAIIPDHPATKEVRIRETAQALGDGRNYTSRFGLNSFDTLWKLRWDYLTHAEFATIESFLIARADDGRPLEWTPPDAASPQQFKVEEWRFSIDNPAKIKAELVFRFVREVGGLTVTLPGAGMDPDLLLSIATGYYDVVSTGGDNRQVTVWSADATASVVATWTEPSHATRATTLTITGSADAFTPYEGANDRADSLSIAPSETATVTYNSKAYPRTGFAFNDVFVLPVSATTAILVIRRGVARFRYQIEFEKERHYSWRYLGDYDYGSGVKSWYGIEYTENVTILHDITVDLEDTVEVFKAFLVGRDFVNEIDVPAGLVTAFDNLRSAPFAPTGTASVTIGGDPAATGALATSDRLVQSYNFPASITTFESSSTTVYNPVAGVPSYSSADIEAIEIDDERFGLIRQYGIGYLLDAYHIEEEFGSPAIFSVLNGSATGIKTTPISNARSYSFVRTNYLPAANLPGKLLAPCAVEGSCDVFYQFDVTTVEPSTISSVLTSGDFIANPEGAVVEARPSGSDRFVAWNWGDTSYCVNQLLALGFAVTDIGGTEVARYALEPITCAEDVEIPDVAPDGEIYDNGGVSGCNAKLNPMLTGFASVVIQLPLSSTFADVSSYGHTVTTYGSCSINSGVTQHGQPTLAIPGEGSFLVADMQIGTDADFLTGPFTIEGDFLFDTSIDDDPSPAPLPMPLMGQKQQLGTDTGDDTIQWDLVYRHGGYGEPGPSSGEFWFRYKPDSETTAWIVYYHSLSLGVFNHIRVTRKGETPPSLGGPLPMILGLYVNGEEVIPDLIPEFLPLGYPWCFGTVSLRPTSYFYVGSPVFSVPLIDLGRSAFIGRVANVRLSQRRVSTGPFTPPSAPYSTS